MSGINAVNASNVNFKGKDKTERKSNTGEISETDNSKKSRSARKPLKETLTAPVRDQFKKAYGEDAKATPSLVADFISDNAIKIGTLVAGGALIFAKSRKATNGMTKALRENIGKFGTAAEGEKTNILKRSVTVVKDAFAQVKANNLADAQKTASEAARKGEKSIMGTVKDAVLKPKEFDQASGLGKFVDKHLGKNAEQAKKFLGKAGIANGSDLADTAIAGAATAALTGGAHEIAGDVTEKDNKELAREAKIQEFENLLNSADKFADALSMVV